MKTPELSDLRRFFVEMHGSEDEARIEYDRFMAGELAPEVLAYCRKRVARDYAPTAAETPRSIFLPAFLTVRFDWAWLFAAMHSVGRWTHFWPRFEPSSRSGLDCLMTNGRAIRAASSTRARSGGRTGSLR
jgi:hypothetical protein